MGNIAIISTGDAEKDAKALEQAETFDSRLKEDLCANGCALLEWETPHAANCPVCGFHYSTPLPYGKHESEQVM